VLPFLHAFYTSFPFIYLTLRTTYNSPSDAAAAAAISLFFIPVHDANIAAFNSFTTDKYLKIASRN
jgi:hypothetical protein